MASDLLRRAADEDAEGPSVLREEPPGGPLSERDHVPRWEWRTFGDDFGDAEHAFAESHRSGSRKATSCTCSRSRVMPPSRLGGLLDVKELLAVNEEGLQQWKPVLKASFPVSERRRSRIRGSRCRRSGARAVGLRATSLVSELVAPNPALRAVEVQHREHRTVRRLYGRALADRSVRRRGRGARSPSHAKTRPQ